MCRFFQRLFMGMVLLFALAAGGNTTCLAEAGNATVKLNDGAAIPYLQDYQSRFICDQSSIQGITGAADITFAVESIRPKLRYDIHVQNVALTDDVLVLFFTQHCNTPINYAGELHAAYSSAVYPLYDVFVGDTRIDKMLYREGYPMDATTEACMIAYALERPVAADENICIKQADGKTIPLTVDKSQAADTTRAVTPKQEVSLRTSAAADGTEIDFHFVVERVAQTPFGGRVSISYEATGEDNVQLPYQVMDDQGQALPTFTVSRQGGGSATREQPQWVRNDAWFLGGMESTALSIVPLSFAQESANVSTPVAMNELPAQVTLANGTAILVDHCKLTKDGFEIGYTPVDYFGSISFELGDAAGTALAYPFESIGGNTNDHVKQQLGFDALWSTEYKGRVVHQITEAQLDAVKTVIVFSSETAPTLMTEQAIHIAMEP